MIRFFSPPCTGRTVEQTRISSAAACSCSPIPLGSIPRTTQPTPFFILKSTVFLSILPGRDAPSHGEAKNSWLTGTAAWNFVAITQHILGIRPTYDGLMVAPVIPEAWKGFRASRVFQGVRYDIEVKRIGRGNAVLLTVDGEAVEGSVIPRPEDGRTQVTVRVRLGG